jgi:hypothetical protein
LRTLKSALTGEATVATFTCVALVSLLALVSGQSALTLRPLLAVATWQNAVAVFIFVERT